MIKKRYNGYAPRQTYIYPDNIKDISLTYNSTKNHTYVNIIGLIIYFNHVGKKSNWKRKCVVYGSHKYFPIGILFDIKRKICLTLHLS